MYNFIIQQTATSTRLPDGVNPQIAEMQNSIISDVALINNYNTLLQLQNYVNKDKLMPLIRKSLMKKHNSINGHDEFLFNILVSDNFPIIDKINTFNKIVSNSGVFDGSEILKYFYSNLYNIIKQKNEVIGYHAETIAKKCGKMNYGSADLGPGEFLLATFGKDISLATKSDLKIKDKTVEVKATTKGKSSIAGGRMVSTAGFGSPTSIRKDLYNLMLNLQIPHHELVLYGMAEGCKTSIIGGLNLNISGLSNLNNLILQYTDYNGSVAIFTTILKGLYTYINPTLIDKFVKHIKPNGSFDVENIRLELAKVAFDYYKSVEGFDYIMFLNINSGFYGLAETSECVDKLYRLRFLRFTSDISWTDDRSKGSAQFIFS